MANVQIDGTGTKSRFQSLVVDSLALKVSVLCWEDGLYEESVFVGEDAITSKTFPELRLTAEQVLAVGNAENDINH